MSPVGTALKFGVVLHADVELVLRNFHRFHQVSVGAGAGKAHTALAVAVPESVVEFVAVAVAFVDLFLAVSPGHNGVLRDLAGISAQPHGAALGGDAHLVAHQGDDGVAAVFP